ncbi:MAG: xseB [Acidimicrobiales bacterium]|nr:xseB [Acidimicrobiales bacterium]
MTDPDASAAPAEAGPEPGYAAALGELEVILDRIEHADLDVDRLAADVARAAELVRRCRDRIAAARVEVERVTAELDAEA